MATKSKTIYFLGAGFSADAGGPIQNQIIQSLLSDEFAQHYQDDNDTMKCLKSFKAFLSSELLIDSVNFDKVALEDVFTPIDRCLADGKSFGKYSVKQLADLRDELHNLMARSIQFRVDARNGEDADYVYKFARFINSYAKKRFQQFWNDSISVITTNWDILLDNRLFHIAKDETDNICSGNIKTGPIAVVDYCCYISSLEPDNYIKPGLFALGRKGYNIKYLKLHGSMNWLHRPLCQRLYVKFDKKTIFETKYCKHCKRNFNLNPDQSSIKLKGNLLLPTFLKDLSNIQIQLVWQNAGIELSEASKIVFIGYSLPAADFEIRQLLSRFIRKDAEIDVVIYPGIVDDEENQKRIDLETNRYKVFFGSRKINIILKMIPEYIDSLTI